MMNLWRLVCIYCESCLLSAPWAQSPVKLTVSGAKLTTVNKKRIIQHYIINQCLHRKYLMIIYSQIYYHIFPNYIMQNQNYVK